MSSTTSPATAPQWWLASQGAPTGPHSEAFVLAGLRTEAISPQTKACPDGDKEWRRLCDWPAFAADCSDTPQAHATTASASPTQPLREKPPVAPNADLQKTQGTLNAASENLGAKLGAEYPEPTDDEVIKMFKEDGELRAALFAEAEKLARTGGVTWNELRFVDKCVVVLRPAVVAFFWLLWLAGIGDKPGYFAKRSWDDIRDSNLKDNCILLAILVPVYAMIGAAIWGLWAMASRIGLLKALACVLVPCVLVWVLGKIYKEVQKKTNTAVALLVGVLVVGFGIWGFDYFFLLPIFSKMYWINKEVVRCSDFRMSLKSSESSDDVLIRYDGLDEEGCKSLAGFLRDNNYSLSLAEAGARKECSLVSPSVSVEIRYTTGDKVTKNFDWDEWQAGTTKTVTFARPALGKPEMLRLEGRAYYKSRHRLFHSDDPKPSFAGEWDLMKE